MVGKDLDTKIISDVVDRLVYISTYNKISNASELEKYIYTHDFSEESFLEMKKVFKRYGEMNVYNCIIFFVEKKLTRKELIKKIKGVI